MQHLDVNFGGIWRFELGFLYLGIVADFLQAKYNFTRKMATLRF